MTLAIRSDAAPAALVKQETSPLVAGLAPYRQQVSSILPEGITFEQVVQELAVCAHGNPAIVKAFDKDPAGVVIALCRAVRTGLILGETVHILPFYMSKQEKYQVNVVVQVQGLIELMNAAGFPVSGSEVWDCDDFDFNLGSDPWVKHRPGPVAKRKKIIGAYAVGYRKGFPHQIKWVDRDEIEATRAKSQSWKGGTLEEKPWYANKTAIRRIASRAPKNPRLAVALELMDAESPEIASTASATARIAAAEQVEPVTPPVQQETDEHGAQPAADDGLTLKEALALVVNKQALGDCRNSGLRRTLEWAREKIDESDGPTEKLERIAAAAKMILEAREAGTIAEPPKKGEAAAPPPKPPKPVAAPAPDEDDDLPF